MVRPMISRRRGYGGRVTRLHPQVQEYLDAIAATDGSPLWQCTPLEAREREAAMPALLDAGVDAAAVAVHDVRIPVDGEVAIDARVTEPAAGPAAGTVVFLHGGGWVLGTIELADPMCRRLTVRSGCRVVNVGYRLAPEHPYPAAVQDAWAALRWAAQRWPGPLVVMGESAGGTLAAGCARRAVERGGPALALQVLVNPVCDSDGLTPELAWFWDHYAPPERRGEPDASPLAVADLHGQAPALIVQPDHDPLRDEVLAYAGRLEAAGVPVRLDRVADVRHGFFFMVGAFHRADEAVDRAAAEIRARSPRRRSGA
jgi:acetyl esterase